MTRARTKRALVALVLALVASWPAVHFLASRRVGFDPWMFFGWAMYAAPDPTVEVTVAELHGNRADELALDAASRDAVRRWAGRRSTWGRALRPDRLALELGAAYPTVETLWIRVRTLRLDRGSALVVADDETFTYARPPVGGRSDRSGRNRSPVR